MAPGTPRPRIDAAHPMSPAEAPMRDHLFTMTPDGPGLPSELLERMQEEMQRNLLRMKHFSEMVMNPKEPEVGPTPREEIYRKNKSRLWRYASKRTVRTPLLFVPNLGISRPYIFDLMRGGSFIEYMTQQGFDFYLLDWGVFGPEDNDLTVEDAVTKILPRMARKALESSRASEMSVLGYCMGAPLSACFLASRPDFPLKNYVDMAGPVDFAHVGLFGLWLDPRFFDVDKYVDTLGSIPADMVKLGFKFLKPTMDLSTNLNLWWNLWNPQYVTGFNALNKWANEYLPFPGEFFRQWVKDFYQGNKLIKGELTMGGRPVRLERISCPVLAVGAKEDNIAPPACVKPLIQTVSSRDCEYVELPGGHISLIAGRGASVHCWPKVASWLAARS
jgi:polyhydroxyalkanoate synthase subunit PhaC